MSTSASSAALPRGTRRQRAVARVGWPHDLRECPFEERGGFLIQEPVEVRVPVERPVQLQEPLIELRVRVTLSAFVVDDLTPVLHRGHELRRPQLRPELHDHVLIGIETRTPTTRRAAHRGRHDSPRRSPAASASRCGRDGGPAARRAPTPPPPGRVHGIRAASQLAGDAAPSNSHALEASHSPTTAQQLGLRPLHHPRELHHQLRQRPRRPPRPILTREHLELRAQLADRVDSDGDRRIRTCVRY